MKQKTIKAIGTFVPRTNFQDGERYNKFGLGELIRIILNNAYGVGMFGQGSDIRKIFENKLENFFTRLETDLPTIKKRQALFAALLEDTELVTFLITRRYPEFPNSDRDRDVESSRLNDAVAIDSISYLDELSRLIAKNPAYARLRSILSGICKDAPWLEQMRSLAENSLQYSKYGIKARFKIFTDYDGSEEKQLKFESSSYKLDFFTNKVSVPMYSRMSIRTDIRKMKRKVQLDYIRVDQKNNLVSDDLWRGLIMKALSSETLQKMWTLKKETFGVSVQIKVDAISGSTEAVVKFDGQKSAEFIYLLAKNPKYDWETESYRWLAVGEEYFPGEEKRLPDFLDSVENFKNAHLFAGSRSFIYSYMKEFKNLFSSLDELLMLGAIANFYQKNSGKWVMPKMLPMESMITDIVGGMNPLFFTKGKGVSIPNNI